MNGARPGLAGTDAAYKSAIAAVSWKSGRLHFVK